MGHKYENPHFIHIRISSGTADDLPRPSVTPDIEKAYAELKDMFSSAKARQMEKEKPEYFG